MFIYISLVGIKIAEMPGGFLRHDTCFIEQTSRKNSPVKRIAEELPDIFSNTLHLETYEDDEECFKAQEFADKIAWYSDKWEIRHGTRRKPFVKTTIS